MSSRPKGGPMGGEWDATLAQKGQNQKISGKQ